MLLLLLLIVQPNLSSNGLAYSWSTNFFSWWVWKKWFLDSPLTYKKLPPAEYLKTVVLRVDFISLKNRTSVALTSDEAHGIVLAQDQLGGHEQGEKNDQKVLHFKTTFLQLCVTSCQRMTNEGTYLIIFRAWDKTRQTVSLFDQRTINFTNQLAEAFIGRTNYRSYLAFKL